MVHFYEKSTYIYKTRISIKHPLKNIFVRVASNKIKSDELSHFVSGIYHINVISDGQHIPKSPFKVTAVAQVDVSTVRCNSLKRYVLADRRAEFVIDASQTVRAQLDLKIVDRHYKKCPCAVLDNKDRTFSCFYVPYKKGNHKFLLPVRPALTLSWWRSLSYRNQSIDFLCK